MFPQRRPAHLVPTESVKYEEKDEEGKKQEDKYKRLTDMSDDTLHPL